MEMMLDVAMGMIDMEDDKVADMVLMIPNEDFSGGTVAIGNTQWDDIRGNDEGIGHGGWQDGAIWWLNFRLMQVPDG